jgi:hypothetical protein
MMVTWSGGATFNVYKQVAPDAWIAVDVFARYGDDRGYPIKSHVKAVEVVEQYFDRVTQDGAW